jgi:hypothetical protein
VRHLRRLSVTNWLGFSACILVCLYLAIVAPGTDLAGRSTKPHEVTSRSPTGAEGRRGHARAWHRLQIAQVLQPAVGPVVVGFVVLMTGVCLVNLWSTARLRAAYWHDKHNA